MRTILRLTVNNLAWLIVLTFCGLPQRITVHTLAAMVTPTPQYIDALAKKSQLS